MKNENKNKKTILITEDNPSNMKLIKDLLTFYNYRTIEAHDGQSALDQIKIFQKEIDLILMDLQLPKIDGIEVIKIIKSDIATFKIPVIVISAHAMDTDIEKAMKAGCADYITKPINITGFIKKIDEFFAENN